MITISSAVKSIINESVTLIDSLQLGILNMSAYARIIQKEVEQKTKKEVSVESIVVAISRLQVEISKFERTEPKVQINELVIKTNLTEYIFNRNVETQELLVQVNADNKSSSDYLVYTYGMHEISIIVSSSIKKKYEKIFTKLSPKLVMDGLICISMNINPEAIKTPNTFYALLKLFAPSKINIIEILTTYSDISIIVEEKDLPEALKVLERKL